jgi:hypothetical protein
MNTYPDTEPASLLGAGVVLRHTRSHSRGKVNRLFPAAHDGDDEDEKDKNAKRQNFSGDHTRLPEDADLRHVDGAA